MYILIKKSLCPHLKMRISRLIDVDEIDTWEFVNEDGRRRLKHTVNNGQYNDVVLRFINTLVDGESFIKILPTKSIGSQGHEDNSHLAIVLGRFAELLNVHFVEIGHYQTILE